VLFGARLVAAGAAANDIMIVIYVILISGMLINEFLT